jgi:hypothetical protein
MRVQIHYDGRSDEWMHFTCPSFTKPDVEYNLGINTKTGVLHCDCPGAVCHLNNRHPYDKWDADGCKHQKLLRSWLRDNLEGSKL